jgi:hypothetical protein
MPGFLFGRSLSRRHSGMRPLARARNPSFQLLTACCVYFLASNKHGKLYLGVTSDIHAHGRKGFGVSTDEWGGYNLLKGDGYDHMAVNHRTKEWTKYNYRRDEYHHTNNVESFWRLFKNSIRSTHIHVSQKYVQRYLSKLLSARTTARGRTRCSIF